MIVVIIQMVKVIFIFIYFYFFANVHGVVCICLVNDNNCLLELLKD